MHPLRERARLVTWGDAWGHAAWAVIVEMTHGLPATLPMTSTTPSERPRCSTRSARLKTDLVGTGRMYFTCIEAVTNRCPACRSAALPTTSEAHKEIPPCRLLSGFSSQAETANDGCGCAEDVSA